MNSDWPQNPIKTKQNKTKQNRTKYMGREAISLLLLGLVIIASSAGEHEHVEKKSIYEHLQDKGLPMGLFPKGITEYTVDPVTGQFQINLTEPCNAQLENPLRYDFNVSGTLSLGSITGLSGVTQQDLFLWFPVHSIRVDSGLVHFDVGVVDKQLSASLFEFPLPCSSPPSTPTNESGELTPGIGKDHVLMAVS